MQISLNVTTVAHKDQNFKIIPRITHNQPLLSMSLFISGRSLNTTGSAFLAPVANCLNHMKVES